MWSNRVRKLIELVPEVSNEIHEGMEVHEIFSKLQLLLLDERFWLQIAQIFSPIIIHLVSEIVMEKSMDLASDELGLMVLFANLFSTFPSIQPLACYFFSHRKLSIERFVTDICYIRTVFRLLNTQSGLIDVSISFLNRAMAFEMTEEIYFYFASILSIVERYDENRFMSMINEKVGTELRLKLYLEEEDFSSKKLSIFDFGPMDFDSTYATTVNGVPFLRSLSSVSDINNHSITKSPFSRSLALSMLTNKPVMIMGPPGCGKTTLIHHLAALAGVGVVSLHLGASVDVKSLLGGYVCGEIPGEFKWLDGPLTSAIRSNDKWIVFEQIEEANPDVLSLLTPLLSEHKLFIPGRSESIIAGYNTRIFATSYSSHESSHWTKIRIDFLKFDSLRDVLLNTHPKLSAVIDRILNSWDLMKGLTYHELFRCCKRLEVFELESGSVSDEVYSFMFQVVVDTFTSHLPSNEKRIEKAFLIAHCWGLSPHYAESYLSNSKPQLVLSPFKIGPVELPFYGKPINITDFAPTFTSLHHMESVARSIYMKEPVLLVGETGTGKTTLVQFIASAVGANLSVINMHHQSDTLDILGGFKPVDLHKLLLPLREKFIDAFRKTFSQKANASAIEKIHTSFEQKQWTSFLKNIAAISRKASEKEGIEETIKNDWIYLSNTSVQFLSRKDFIDRDFAFGFVEGPLARAFRTGQWILLDEVNLAPPETLLSLAPIIDGELVLPNGEIVNAHENFRLICCMNPPTDVGKVGLPETLLHKFTSVFTDETSSESDIKLILTQRSVNMAFHQIIYDFYSKSRQMSRTTLVDGSGRRIIYSLRALARAISYMNKAEPIYGPYNACKDALTLSFISPLSPESSSQLRNVLDSLISSSSHQLPKSPSYGSDMICVEGFFLHKGPNAPKQREDFILTETARIHLRSIAQAAFLRNCPILLQGPTSSGKTSIIEYLADITGHDFVRINNHEQTDISEYIGGYTTSQSGKFEFIEGALVRAIRSGSWVVLDELNLAPSDVLEALNRLLDQNNQLYIAETQTMVNPGQGFQLFATQNPPGTYGGRKQLSRAFRGRFLEIHVDEIPPTELKSILMMRCHLPDSFASSMVNVFLELRKIRQFSQVFAGKHSFLTVRDLLRWANRNPSTWNEVADEGFAILGERLRTKEERTLLSSVITEKCKAPIMNIEFTIPEVHLGFDIVWTTGMKRCVDLLFRCVRNGEPALLVGETGTGKTTAVQVVASSLGRKLRILNCHQHTETSDFIGAMRPAKSNSDQLFEWIDGSLVEAMKNGEVYLADEISLAQDSALERLNSVLEPSRILAIAEKPEYEVVKADPNFVFIATMNPGGDYGKRELSPSLRNRFTEIWVPSIESDSDLLEILASNSSQTETKEHLSLFLHFVRYYSALSKATSNISMRDVLQWIRFVDLRVSQGISFADSYVNGAFMVFIDCVFNTNREQLISFLNEQIAEAKLYLHEPLGSFSHEVSQNNDRMLVGSFELSTGPTYIPNSSSFVFSAPTTSENLLRVARALQLSLPVLIEGPPGVGKTSLVASLGESLGFTVVRINLSEHTEMLDLVGSELPVEGAESGTFSWRDGAFLTSLKNGYWVILDELNLASQSVLEGLNSCLDHRASLFVPELGQEFKCHPQFRIFGCQNPASAGHGRKSLPRSFLNRFTRVYVEELGKHDFSFIISQKYPSISQNLRDSIIGFLDDINTLNYDFEFNLRDVFRWCEMIVNAQISYQKALQQLFIQRIRSLQNRAVIIEIAQKHFPDFTIEQSGFNLSPTEFSIGEVSHERSGSICSSNLVIHPSIVSQLESILITVKMGWPSLLVGTTATSKSSTIRLAAHILGKKLVEFSMNSSVDTTELLGGFEQVDSHRCFEQLRDKAMPYLICNDKALEICQNISQPSDFYRFVIDNEQLFSNEISFEAQSLHQRSNDPGKFEWVDGLLLQAMRNGWWIILDNANICPPAVLDRLNPLCEPGGCLSLNERGIVKNDIEIIYPHSEFRLFMTVDPKNGEVSRAMRNRSIEVYFPNYSERFSIDPNLKEETRALAGEFHAEFLDIFEKCKDNESRYLTSWNMLSLKSFREQVAIAQLGPDAAYFNVIHSQIVNETPPEKDRIITRSNSCLDSFDFSDKCLSVFRFSPLSISSINTVIYDSSYLNQLGENFGAYRFFVSNTHEYDIDYRLLYTKKWPVLHSIMNRLKESELLHFNGNNSIDPLFYPFPIKTLAFTAHFLLLSLNLENSDVYSIDAIDIQLRLYNIVPLLYKEIIDLAKDSILSDQVEFSHLLLLRIIHIINHSPKTIMPLLRFIKSIIKKSSFSIQQNQALASIVSPEDSIKAKVLRHTIGIPFSFKTQSISQIWNSIVEYSNSLFMESTTTFFKQYYQLIQMLSSMVFIPESHEKIYELFNRIKTIKIPIEPSITFIDEIEEMERIREIPTTVSLSSPFPSELLVEVSIYSMILIVIDSIINEKSINIPKLYGIPMELLGLIDSYNNTKSNSDLIFALFELIHHIDNMIFIGPANSTFKSILNKKISLIQSIHTMPLLKTFFEILTQCPSFTQHQLIEALVRVFTNEAQKLGIDIGANQNIQDLMKQYVVSKWKVISPISEIDDSFYHMVVCDTSSQVIKQLEEESETLQQIVESRINNTNHAIIQSYSKEIEYLMKHKERSIKKSKYRSNPGDYEKLKSIIKRISIGINTKMSKETSDSIKDSATSLVLEFPDYKDITIPIVSTLRQIVFFNEFPYPNSTPLLPFPFTSTGLLTSIFNNGYSHYSPLTFSLIGHTKLVHPKIVIEFPKLSPDYSTISEEEKQAKQIEELFSNTKKVELNIIAHNFVDSFIRPFSIPLNSLLSLYNKQLKKFQIQNPSIEADSTYLPFNIYLLYSKNNTKSKDISIYDNSSMKDGEELFNVIKQVIELTFEVWKRYPGHDHLRRIIKSADSIIKKSIDSPLIEYLDSLEILMTEIRDWQYKDRDFGPVLLPLVKLANKWLKLRLSSWKHLFESRRQALETNYGRNFYIIMEYVDRLTMESIPDFFVFICDFIDSSAIGLLSANLDLLEAIALYSLRFEIGNVVFSLLINLVTKFRSFIPIIEGHIKLELAPLEKTMSEYIELQKWDSNSDKKHFLNMDTVKRQLNKYCQQHMNIINPAFKLMIDQFSQSMSRQESVPFGNGSLIDAKCDELFNTKETLRNRLYEARRYASSELDISIGDNQERRDIGNPVLLFGHKPLYGQQFAQHNQLFGEALVLLSKIRKMYIDPHADLLTEAKDFLGLSENLVVFLLNQRNELFAPPVFKQEPPIFVINQITSVLKAFSSIDTSVDIGQIITQIDALSRFSIIPICDISSCLSNINSRLTNNYAHNSIKLFIDRSISILNTFGNYRKDKIPDFNISIANYHLSCLRFACALMRQISNAFVDGYGENTEEQSEEKPTEGTDGVGLGEGLGNQDVTNEIEDEDQLLGDNVNTNKDKQDENDVERDGGFEVEPDIEDAPDVSAHEEEEKMDDEMGKTEDGDGIDSRDAQNENKEADKETELERETNTKEQKMGEENDEDEKDEDQEETKEEEKSGTMEMSEQEDQFESDAAQWDSEPEKVELPSDQEHMLNGNSEGEEEIDEEVVDIKPPDIEDEPDEFFGQTAPDKANPEEEDKCDQEDVKGEGKGESKGDGEDGEGDNDKAEEEDKNEDNSNSEEKTLQEIEKELQIVKKNILKGQVQEGNEGGELDDNGKEGTILPADEAEQIPDKGEEEDNGEQNGDTAAPAGDENFIKFDRGEIQSLEETETHIDSSKIEGEKDETLKEHSVLTMQRSVTEEGRTLWQNLINKTHQSGAELCEQLRLVLDATVAAKMKGDYRTGKRLNMRKIIPFIASGFRKDKIWMRRVQPDQRNYQVMLAIDNSESMKGSVGNLALESVCLITQALSLLGIGELCVTKFGHDAEIVHSFGEQWNDDSGAAIMNAFNFEEQNTEMYGLMKTTVSYLETQKKQNSMQLVFIISDGIFSNKEKVRELVIQSQLRNVLIVFVIIDSQDYNNRDSILEMGSIKIGPNKKMMMNFYMDDFPFPFYVVIRNPDTMPEKIASALKQWFDLANSG